jgi:hypothetical protein
MIISFANPQAEEIFLGSWAGIPTAHYGPVEDCFIDLRILDAVAVERDLMVAFEGRIRERDTRGKRKQFEIVSMSELPFVICFVWTGSAVDEASVQFQSGKGGLK